MLVLVVGCSASHKHELTFNDPTGITIARGELRLPDTVPAAGETFEGEWRLTTVAAIFPPNATDPTHYRGRVADNGDLVIDLNPQMRDNNVNLTGVWDKSGYYGNWYHSTFAGAREKGTFRVETPRPKK